MAKRKLSDETKNLIKQLISSENATTKEIASRAGVSPSTVSAIRKKLEETHEMKEEQEQEQEQEPTHDETQSIELDPDTEHKLIKSMHQLLFEFYKKHVQRKYGIDLPELSLSDNEAEQLTDIALIIYRSEIKKHLKGIEMAIALYGITLTAIYQQRAKLVHEKIKQQISNPPQSQTTT